MKKESTFYYVTVPRELVNDLTPPELKLVCILQGYMGKQSFWMVGNEELAEQYKCNSDNVRRICSKLVKRGLYEKIEQSGSKSIFVRRWKMDDYNPRKKDRQTEETLTEKKGGTQGINDGGPPTETSTPPHQKDGAHIMVGKKEIKKTNKHKAEGVSFSSENDKGEVPEWYTVLKEVWREINNVSIPAFGSINETNREQMQQFWDNDCAEGYEYVSMKQAVLLYSRINEGKEPGVVPRLFVADPGQWLKKARDLRDGRYRLPKRQMTKREIWKNEIGRPERKRSQKEEWDDEV